jgi:hypothetical protein
MVIDSPSLECRREHFTEIDDDLKILMEIAKIRVKCPTVCQLMTNLLTRKFPIPVRYVAALLNKLFSQFKFHLRKCKSDDFPFLSWIACQSKSCIWHFGPGTQLLNLLETLEEDSHNQIKDIFGLAEDLLELGRKNPMGEDAESTVASIPQQTMNN